MMRIAYEDALTDTMSKAAFDIAREKLEADIAEGKTQFAIIVIDLDNLKTVNDTYGHKHGDSYIKGACALLRETFGDTPIYRIGGDEFVIILEGTEYERRIELIEDARRRFAATRNNEDREPWERYSASIGMSSIRDSNERYQAVFSRADEDMYRRKKERK